MANDDQKSRILDRSAPFDDPESKKYLSGVAFHWYQNLDFILPFVGSYKKLKKFYKAYPDMFMLGTEACEGYMPGFTGTGKGPALHNPEKAWKRAENYARDIIENSNSMAGGWVDWNLFLNTNGGPNWANNMVDAPILVDAQNGAESINSQCTISWVISPSLCRRDQNASSFQRQERFIISTIVHS
ncbi:unnamed protein product [Peronospora farinosa]|uniref:Glycosyl hydrolase family 30 TIM-barrel domain-containing protein n=1 Tax=Peronospora farinosa TaxID=134698 RepID=A0ABN8C6P9_9STRA|nr:unnamed protein product [Peronospora farinosa]